MPAATFHPVTSLTRSSQDREVRQQEAAKISVAETTPISSYRKIASQLDQSINNQN